MSDHKRPTPSQLAVLEYAATAINAEGWISMWPVQFSFATVKSCTKAGWLEREGKVLVSHRLTDAGRAAIIRTAISEEDGESHE